MRWEWRQWGVSRACSRYQGKREAGMRQRSLAKCSKACPGNRCR